VQSYEKGGKTQNKKAIFYHIASFYPKQTNQNRQFASNELAVCFFYLGVLLKKKSRLLSSRLMLSMDFY